MSHYGLAIYIKKYLKAILFYFFNEKSNYISPCKNIILKKKILRKKPKSFQRNQNPSRHYYYNSIITNLKFQHRPKYHIKKIPHTKIDLLFPRGQNPLSYYYTL
jgi:hypothetical protein